MRKLRVGEKASDFKLPGVDGKNHTLTELTNGHKAVVVVFTCNHSPHAKAYEERLIALQRDYEKKRVQFLCINSNDASSYPEDSFDQMKVRAAKKGFNFPYLRDELQVVARAYGAECTPETFLLDGSYTLRYNGRIDDNWQNPSAVNSNDLRDALDALLPARKLPTPSLPPSAAA